MEGISAENSAGIPQTAIFRCCMDPRQDLDCCFGGRRRFSFNRTDHERIDTMRKPKIVGQCLPCLRKYIWPAELMRLFDAHCPRCGRRIFAASRFPCRISREMPVGPDRAWGIRAVLAIDIEKIEAESVHEMLRRQRG